MQEALVPFYEDKILSFYNETLGKAYFSPRHVCEALGLSWGGQRVTIINDEILGPEILRVDIYTQVQDREMILLPLTYFTGWLFKIQAKRVREDIRPKLLLYQRECHDVLHAYWLNGGVVVNHRTDVPNTDMSDMDILQYTLLKEVNKHHTDINDPSIQGKDTIDPALQDILAIYQEVNKAKQIALKRRRETEKYIPKWHKDFLRTITNRACFRCGERCRWDVKVEHPKHGHYVYIQTWGTEGETALTNEELLCYECHVEKIRLELHGVEWLLLDYRSQAIKQAAHEEIRAHEETEQTRAKDMQLNLFIALGEQAQCAL